MKNKDEIAQLLKKIKESEAIAKAEIPPNTEFKDVAGYARLRVQSQEAAYTYTQQYLAYVKQHLGGIILHGPRAAQLEFAELAQKMGKTITFDSDKLYLGLTEKAFMMLGGKGSLTADQLALIYSEIRLLSRSELGIFRLRDPNTNWMFNYAWNTHESLADGIRKAVFDTNGVKLTAEALLKTVKDDCLANPNARTTIPVVFVGMKKAEEDEFKAAFGHGYIVVSVGNEPVTEDAVKQAFVELRETIKNHNGNNTQTKETTNGKQE